MFKNQKHINFLLYLKIIQILNNYIKIWHYINWSHQKQNQGEDKVF